jgi:hypothetical protein
VSGCEIVHFPFLEMLCDLLGSSKFTDVNNLCVNPSIADRFSQFVPTIIEDCSKLMSKQWANDTFASLEDFDPDNDLFFPLVLYVNKTGTDINQWYLLVRRRSGARGDRDSHLFLEHELTALAKLVIFQNSFSCL